MHRGKDKAPSQLSGGVRRRSGKLIREHDNAEPGTGCDVDVRADAAQADES